MDEILARERTRMSYPPFDWRRTVCLFLQQPDLFRLTLVSRDWNEAATSILYINPDLSQCNGAQFLSFYLSVRASKTRRRSVRTLDLIKLSPQSHCVPTALDKLDIYQLDSMDECRHSGPIFLDLFSMFRRLQRIRIYGNSMTDSTRAHWTSFKDTLVELKIYNLNSLSDRGVLAIASHVKNSLQHLHLEHSLHGDESNSHDSYRGLRVGTVNGLISTLRRLRRLGIGCPIVGIRNEKNFMENLFDLEALTFIGVPDVDFQQLQSAPLLSKWRSLTVRDCPRLSALDFEAVLRRLPKLQELDWRFPVDSFYDWTKYEIKSAGLRQLQTLTIANSSLSDQCLTRLLRVLSNLDRLAISNCDEIHRFRDTCARYITIEALSSFLSDLYDGMEETLFDLSGLVVINQRFMDAISLRSSIEWMFRDGRHLEYIELRNCQIGASKESLDEMCRMLGKKLEVFRDDASSVILITPTSSTLRRDREPMRNGINLIPFHHEGKNKPVSDAGTGSVRGEVQAVEMNRTETVPYGVDHDRCPKVAQSLTKELKESVLDKDTDDANTIHHSDNLQSSQSTQKFGNETDKFLAQEDSSGGSCQIALPIATRCRSLGNLTTIDGQDSNALRSDGSVSILVGRGCEEIPRIVQNQTAVACNGRSCSLKQPWREFRIEDLERGEDEDSSAWDLAKPGWPIPQQEISWDSLRFGAVERQKKTMYYNPNPQYQLSVRSRGIGVDRGRNRGIPPRFTRPIGHVMAPRCTTNGTKENESTTVQARFQTIEHWSEIPLTTSTTVQPTLAHVSSGDVNLLESPILDKLDHPALFPQVHRIESLKVVKSKVVESDSGPTRERLLEVWTPHKASEDCFFDIIHDDLLIAPLL